MIETVQCDRPRVVAWGAGIHSLVGLIGWVGTVCPYLSTTGQNFPIRIREPST
jgi:hypothetical protein